MERLGRSLVIGIATLSTLLCLMTFVLWWRSERFLFGTDDIITFSTASREILMASSRGELSLGITDFDNKGNYFAHRFSYQALRQNPAGNMQFRSSILGAEGADFEWLGIYYSRMSGSMTYLGYHPISVNIIQREMGVPHWMVILLGGLGPWYWYRQARGVFRRRQRVAAGHCAVCGYDLQGTPGRCPECGTAPPNKVIASN
jgi:hypothetical protein